MFFDTLMSSFETHRDVVPSLSQQHVTEQHPWSAQGHISPFWIQQVPQQKKDGRTKEGGILLEAVSEHQVASNRGFFVRSGRTAGPLTATAPCGTWDEAVHEQLASTHVPYLGATSGALKPGCAAMRTSVNVLQYGTLSMTFLQVTSASLSYSNPATVAGPRALSESPWESPCRESVTAKPLRSFIIDSVDMRWVEWGEPKETSKNLFSKERRGKTMKKHQQGHREEDEKPFTQISEPAMTLDQTGRSELVYDR